MLKAGIITQARMTSTRLPGKILLTAGGRTVLEHHVRRLSWSNVPVFVATTVNATDQAVVDLAERLGVTAFRGDENNVLERFHGCAAKYNLDVVIRVTSDCPLIDGHIVAEGLAEYMKLNDRNVYYSNCLVRTFPRGMDFEIFSLQLLRQACQNATASGDKEHVTPYINQNKSGQVKIVHHTTADDHSQLRWTLDTTEDWELIRTLLDDHKAADLRYEEILRVVNQNSGLATLNTHIKQKEI